MSDQLPHDGSDDSIHEQGPHGQQSGNGESGPQYEQVGYDQSQQNSYGYAQQGGYQQGYYAPQQQSGGTNTSAIVLTVVSALSCVVGLFPAGLAGLVLGIVALTKQSNDLPKSRKFSKIGWIVWSVMTVVLIIAFIAWVASGNFKVTAAGSSG